MLLRLFIIKTLLKKIGVSYFEGVLSFGKTKNKGISYLLERRLQKENEMPAYLRFTFRSSSLPASSYGEERENVTSQTVPATPLRRESHVLRSGV